MLSHVRLFVTSRTVASLAPLSMGFPRQEYWSRLSFPPPGALPDTGIDPAFPALAGGFFTTEPSMKSPSRETNSCIIPTKCDTWHSRMEFTHNIHWNFSHWWLTKVLLSPYFRLAQNEDISSLKFDIQQATFQPGTEAHGLPGNQLSPRSLMGVPMGLDWVPGSVVTDQSPAQ